MRISRIIPRRRARVAVVASNMILKPKELGRHGKISALLYCDDGSTQRVIIRRRLDGVIEIRFPGGVIDGG